MCRSQMVWTGTARRVLCISMTPSTAAMTRPVALFGNTKRTSWESQSILAVAVHIPGDPLTVYELSVSCGTACLCMMVSISGIQITHFRHWHITKSCLASSSSCFDLGLCLHELFCRLALTSCYCRKVKSLGVNLEGGVPDGMCLDHEGRIWTALCGGSAVVCIDPESGDELHR